MSFWNNPNNNSIKVILLVVVVIGAAWFVFDHVNSGNKGQVLNTSAMPAAQTAPTVASGINAVFATNAKTNTCTITFVSTTNSTQNIIVAGVPTTDSNGDAGCQPNPQQSNQISQGMVTTLMQAQ